MSHQSPAATLHQIARAYPLPRCLHVVAAMGVADALDDAPMTSAELAAAVDADADALARVLRLLAAHGVFEVEGDRFRHSPASRYLRSDHPESLRAFVQMFGSSLNWAAYGELEYSVRTGRPAAEKVSPGGVWAHLLQHPEEALVFNAAMTARAHERVAAILAAYDFSDLGVIGDIGGGRGHLIRAVLDSAPAARGILFDQPHAIEELAGSVPDRLSLQSGDFFHDDLPVCDAYILMDILHDWGDAEAAAILRSVRRAAPSGARLLLIELILGDDPRPSLAKLIDIHMLVLFGGRQRTAREFDALLQSTGFVLKRQIDTAAGVSILEAVTS